MRQSSISPCWQDINDFKTCFQWFECKHAKRFDEDGILNLHFGGKSMLVIGNSLQLPSSGWIVFEHLTPTDAWHLFKL